MKKLFFIILVLILLGSVYYFTRPTPLLSPLLTQTAPSVTPIPFTGDMKTSLYVPYWSLTSDQDFVDADTLIYFGVTPGISGINREEAGYRGLISFLEKAGRKRKYLTLRMLDSKQNFAILESGPRQQELIHDVIQLAVRNGFNGVLLDLEVSALPFASIVDQISTFNKRFYEAAQQSDLHYAVALYGDTYFRIRPFDVKAISENSDEIMLMAYDFHKARGNPGPNFPLGGKEKYGYDYTRLIEQFTDGVPKEKITVIFGYFGYDWVVDEKQNMMEHGDPLSFNQINDRFLTNCSFASCVSKRDDLSSESYVTYVDSDGQKHVVWYEDEISVAKKREFLQTKGISSISFWAHSYY